MAKFQKGPFIELTGGKGFVLGTGRCECGAVNEFKVNKSGWPYHYCVSGNGCGAINETRAIGRARAIVQGVDKFDRTCTRKRAYVLVGLAKSPDSEPDIDGELLAEIDKELENAPVEPPKKKGIKITFFGKEIF